MVVLSACMFVSRVYAKCTEAIGFPGSELPDSCKLLC